MAYTTIDDPEAYFQVALYTGNASTQSITLGGDTDMQPDMVWLKNRESPSNHALHDAVRGATKTTYPDHPSAEDTYTNGVTAFNSDGFSLGDQATIFNKDTEGHVAWCWKAGTTSGISG